MRKRKGFSKARNAHRSKHESTKPKSLPQWYKVASFSGTSSEETERFEIWKSRFRLTWHVSGAKNLIFVAKLGHSGEEIHDHNLILSRGRTAGEKIVNQSGDLYLHIAASNADWSLTVEQEEA